MYAPETTRYSASSEFGLDDHEPHHASSRASADAILGDLTDSDDGSSIRHDDSMQVDEEDEDGQLGEEDGASDSSFSDSLSSSPSIPSSDDIDFGLVYGLHSFMATVDGQVVRPHRPLPLLGANG